MPVDLGRSRNSDPSKRNSITDRLLGSFNLGKGGGGAAPTRRAASVNKQSPIPRIREWLDTCNREHDHHCNAGSADRDDVPTFRPTWLIDSAEKCLVRSKPSDRYLALSYVYGPSRNGMPQLLRSNVEEFQDELPDDDIPQTITDAMWLSRKLGLKYLWVDRLCIVQDDEEQKEAHVKHMAFVFTNAYLTIVAAHGDVYTGLLPLNSRRPSSAKKGSHEELLRESKWNTRCWTLEEHLYSRRCAFFFEDAVTWECHCETWQGSPQSVIVKIRGRQGCDAGPPSTAAYAYRHSPWPDLDEYARIAMDYSSRRVSTVDDTLRAFSGITHMLSRTFPGGFLYGMPLMFLDIALLWRPQASMRRRAMSRPPFLPSWTWMGWWFDGVPVDLTLWRAAADYIDEVKSTAGGRKSKRLQAPNSFKIKPILTWALTDRAATITVPNIGLQFRDLRSRKSSSLPLPPGWSRTGSGFRHDSDDTAFFKYPIPVEDPPEEGGYGPPPGELAYPGPFLSFCTMSCFLEVDYLATLSNGAAPHAPPIAVGNIWSKTQRWAGQFRAHDGWLGIQSSNYEGDEKLEFVAISTATERKGSHVFNEEQFEANKDQDGFLDIVNVLWIERIGGVAYRRGLGHVLQKAWEAQPKKEVDIVLG